MFEFEWGDLKKDDVKKLILFSLLSYIICGSSAAPPPPPPPPAAAAAAAAEKLLPHSLCRNVKFLNFVSQIKIFDLTPKKLTRKNCQFDPTPNTEIKIH